MKELYFVILTCSFWSWSAIPVLSHNERVRIHYQNTELWVQHVVKGPVDLYLSHDYIEKRVTGPRYRKQKTELVERYFLRIDDRIIKLTPYNYKRLIRRHMPQARHLLTRLGQVGFRYENMDHMIRYYNEFVILSPSP